MNINNYNRKRFETNECTITYKPLNPQILRIDKKGI